MSFLVGAEKARVEMPTKVVLDEASLGVNDGDRIGIVGLNGDGKSTLLRLLDGDIQPDSGRVVRTNGVTVGFLRQNDRLSDADTVRQSVVGDRPEFEWASDAKVRSILGGLLYDIGWESVVSELSGGQRRRVDLARVLAGDWDVVMLDEPTNHLDMRTITWLASHLKERWRTGQGALLVVSHDRWFLDETCNLMWEVHDRRVETFEGGFSAYIMQRVERQRVAAVTEQRRQNRLRRELAWLSRGARARATKPKFHVAAARELIADVPELRNPPELKRMAVARIGKDVVEMHNVTISYDSGADGGDVRDADGDASPRNVIDHVDWIIGPGDRIGIVGGNGAGKTTLLNTIQGKIKPRTGKVKIGATVKFTMLSQRLESLDEVAGYRVREVVGRYPHRRMADGKDMTSSKLLEDLGFGRADLNEFVGDLSGGQKRRLALMMTLMEESNVLVLDEPGNDLDVDMLAALEDLLDDWPGTLVLVTHDRNLMERVTDDQYALIDGKLRHLPGGIDEFLQIASARASAPASAASQKPVSLHDGGEAKSQPSSDASGATVAPMSNKERQRLKKLVASNEKKIATAESRLADAERRMAKCNPSDFEALVACQDEIAGLKERISELEDEWLQAQEQLQS